MKDNEMMKKTNGPDLNSNEEYLIPNEAACSHEFAEGCILREDE